VVNVWTIGHGPVLPCLAGALIVPEDEPVAVSRTRQKALVALIQAASNELGATARLRAQ
jgi:hypothetical protein